MPWCGRWGLATICLMPRFSVWRRTKTRKGELFRAFVLSGFRDSPYSVVSSAGRHFGRPPGGVAPFAANCGSDCLYTNTSPGPADYSLRRKVFNWI